MPDWRDFDLSQDGPGWGTKLVQFTRRPRPPVEAQTPLVPDDCSSALEGTTNFKLVFEDRFASRIGAESPPFFTGGLHDAVYAAFEVQNCPLALYIHHDCSVARNIFPDNVLCSDVVLGILYDKFVCWPWDVTTDDNEEMLLGFMAECLIRSPRLSSVPIDNFPLLVLLSKGDDGCPRVQEIVYGSESQDDAVRKLMATMTAHEIVKANASSTVESPKAKEARKVKDQELMEIAKKEQERKDEELKEMAIQMERAQRLAKLKASLPHEPADSAPGTLLISLFIPHKGPVMRRFSRSMPLSVLLTFLESEGMPSDEVGLSPGDGMEEWDPSTTLGEIANWNKSAKPGR